MADKEKDDKNNEFYEGIAKAADFVHDRLGNVQAPTGLNNTVEEYMNDEEGKKQRKGKE